MEKPAGPTSVFQRHTSALVARPFVRLAIKRHDALFEVYYIRVRVRTALLCNGGPALHFRRSRFSGFFSFFFSPSRSKRSARHRDRTLSVFETFEKIEKAKKGEHKFSLDKNAPRIRIARYPAALSEK